MIFLERMMQKVWSQRLSSLVHRVVSRAGLFMSGSGLGWIRARGAETREGYIPPII